MNIIQFSIKHSFFLILAMGIISCTKSTTLETSIQKAKNNQDEIKKVLTYFSRSPKDSLKYKAACFLIENMPGHTTWSNNSMEQYLSRVNKELKITTWDERLLANLLYSRILDPSIEEVYTTEDIETLTSDFLISHIESVFRQKEKYSWLEDVDFNIFCEYLLPYRLDREIPSLWRDSTVKGFQKMHDYIQIYDDTRTSTTNLSKTLVSELWSYWPNIMEKLPSPSEDQYKSNCEDEAISELMLHRLLGIPAAIDFIPCWGNCNGHHVWTQPINRKFHYTNKIEKFNRSIPKVYRMTYSKQFTPYWHKTNEYIPDFFKNIFLKDVTNEYINGKTVKEYNFPKNINYGYLCVFNQGKWLPVSQAKNKSGKCIFSNMGSGIVYLPAYFYQEQFTPISSPFILKDNGDKEYLHATNKRKDMILYRKYPMESRKRHYTKRIIGTKIEASKSKLFKECNTDTLYTIQKNPTMQPIKLKLDKEYHFFQITPATDEGAPIAEIYFYDKKGKRIYGTMEGDTFDKDFLNDNNILTSTCIYKQLLISFNSKDTIASICILPHNDGNGIYPGDEYELFYFDEKCQWISCGKKKAESYKLTFNQIPQGALLWLRNLTSGKEERIFTYKNGTQHFW